MKHRLNTTGALKPYLLLVAVLVAFAICLLEGGCAMQRYNLPQTTTAIFSWGVISNEDRALLEETGVQTVFVEVGEEEDAETLESLSGLDVYLLTGDPSMELDQMKEAVLRAQNNNYAGLVLDVEPYTLDEWSQEESRPSIVNTYCDQMEELYAYAQEHDVELILCIPYWYDDLGLSDQLERIAQACDGMCVMNYCRGNESQNIAAEYELAGKYHKKLWTAYELNQSDGEGVLDYNTYHDQGILAVQENYEQNFANTGIGLAYHDLASLREVTA
ncbi:MAG: hypothetical protein Q4A01_05250 [Coriobacteriales bacterium]|nr:hypothetical protein [Coriobacteriales bacterium]